MLRHGLYGCEPRLAVSTPIRFHVDVPDVLAGVRVA